MTQCTIIFTISHIIITCIESISSNKLYLHNHVHQLNLCIGKPHNYWLTTLASLSDHLGKRRSMVLSLLQGLGRGMKHGSMFYLKEDFYLGKGF